MTDPTRNLYILVTTPDGSPLRATVIGVGPASEVQLKSVAHDLDRFKQPGIAVAVLGTPPHPYGPGDQFVRVTCPATSVGHVMSVIYGRRAQWGTNLSLLATV